MEEYKYKCPNHAGNLNNMRLSDKGCDVTIRTGFYDCIIDRASIAKISARTYGVQVDDKEFRAHKVILAANLKYFESMFFNSFQESEQDVITMTGLMGTDLEAFITYAYTGEITLTHSNALNLLEVANYLIEDDVKAACIEFLRKNLREEDACRVYKFASHIDCVQLKDIAKSIVSSNLENCLQLTEYLDLDPKSLVDILSDKKEESAKTQKMFFEGIMRWIMHDAGNRRTCTKDLLNCIDITQLTAEYLMNYLGKVAYRKDGNGVIEDVMFSYHTSRIEKQKRGKVLMIIGNDIKAKPQYQYYDFVEKSWSPLQEIPDVDGNVNSNSAVLNDKLYYVSENSKKFSLEVFDPSTRRSKILHTSSDILGWTTLCADNRFIYLCGGVMENNLRSEQVLRYDPETNSFEKLTPMASKKSSAAAIFYQNCLHVVGGFDGSFKLDLFDKYDPDTKEWTALAPMCRTRYRHAPAVLDGRLFACGRYIDNSVEVYDPKNNSWQPAAGMNVQRNEFLVVTFEGKLLAIGGDKDITVEVYDPDVDRWQISHELSSGLFIKSPRGGLISGSCVVNDN